MASVCIGSNTLRPAYNLKVQCPDATPVPSVHSELHTQWLTPLFGLDLETQIAVKEELDFAKDRAVVPVLKATLRERRRRK
jgi:hypothetical protein